MGVFESEVALRWSDMDAFGHVNHATTITLLEEARAALLFTEAGRRGLLGMTEGMVVARIAIDYHTPLAYQVGSVLVRMTVREPKAASFVVDYWVSVGESTPVATAQTLMVPYDLRGGRPRRLTKDELAFLAEWRVDSTESEHIGA